jgi:predicted nucleic acid-binding protein
VPAYFFDASALVKRYLRETGSEWVRTTLIFVSADEQLLSITRTLGFAIENPNLHA